MNALKIILAIIFGIIGLIFITINAVIFYKKYIKREQSPSVSPFLGGISGAFAMFLVLENQYKGMIIIPLLLDYGSIPIICEFVYVFISDWVEAITKK